MFSPFTQIDANVVSQESSPGRAESFSNVPDTMYFGGFPGEHDFVDVTNNDFNGCIDGVILDSNTVDLSKSKETLGTARGCPIQVSSMALYYNFTYSRHVKKKRLY